MFNGVEFSGVDCVQFICRALGQPKNHEIYPPAKTDLPTPIFIIRLIGLTVVDI